MIKIKETIRVSKLNELKQFSIKSEKKEGIEKKLSEELINDKWWKDASIIALYASMNHEFNTSFLLNEARKEGKKICYPKTFSMHQMKFLLVTEQTKFKLTSFGVSEPLSEKEIESEKIDLMIVPGIAFQTNGNRIGYGGGYYDMYLKHYSGKTVSLIFPCQLISESLHFSENHDRKIDRIFRVE